MLTQVTNIIEKDDIVMPEVDLVKVRALVDNLTNFEKVGQMSFDDIANLSSLLPDASRSLGIESNLTYESSEKNLILAHEALSNGMKATLVAVITAAIALLLKFFKFRRNKNFTNGGPNDTPRASVSAAEAYRAELMKTSPVLNKQIDEFRAHMDYIVADVGLETIDGDLYPELLGLVNSVKTYTKKFTKMNVPDFERQRDKARLGEILNTYALALGPGNLQYRWISPYNYFFMTERELYPHLRFIEDMFRFIKTNHSFETTIPDLTKELGTMRFQPTRQADFEMGEASEVIKNIFSIIENNFAPKELAKAVGLQVTSKSNYDTFLLVSETFQNHVRTLFGTDMYGDSKSDSEFKEKRMQAYYDFLTTDTRNPVGEVWLRVQEMVEQCNDLLIVAEGVMLKGGKVDFLSESKRLTEQLKLKFDNDMWGSENKSRKLDSQQVQNLADLKEIGVFITSLVRFVAEFSRVVEYTTRLEEKLDDLESNMTSFCKILIEVNTILRKVKE